MASSSKAASSSSHILNVPLESNPPQHKVGIFSALAILCRVFSYIIPTLMFMVSADVISIPDAFKQWLHEPLGLTLCILILFFTSMYQMLVDTSMYMYQMLVDLTKPKTKRSDAGTVTSKKKKKKRFGKKNGRTSSGVGSDEKLNQGVGSDEKLSQGVDESVDGLTIGKLFVSNREIAMGSNGTIVLEGTYDGRRVAVKRFVKACHDVAFNEHLNLSVSDSHPNIVRLYGKESYRDFRYLALERCTCNLNDLIQRSTVSEDQATEVKVRLEGTEVKLWTDKGYPSTILFKLMRDVVSGLVHLHKLEMVHRDLKPQNVLILKEESLCAKLSDLGISKRLVGDKSSLGDHATGCGSSGWQAPEQLLKLQRQTRAVDVFSLGLVFFHCITGGKHPFGDDPLKRDINIVESKADLFLVEAIPEAVDLLSRLLDWDAELRPKASEVLYHPLFWDSDTRLWFLHDVSDRLKLEERKADSDILKALESVSSLAFGTKWNKKMQSAFLKHIGKYRRYKYDSVRDLLRVVRNQLNHYLELPLEIQKILGPVNEEFDGYFRSRYPKLLMEVYKVMHHYCREEEGFNKYFKGSVV